MTCRSFLPGASRLSTKGISNSIKCKPIEHPPKRRRYDRESVSVYMQRRSEQSTKHRFAALDT